MLKTGNRVSLILKSIGMFIKNVFILFASIIICGNVHSQKSGESFEQQFDRQIGYMRYVLQYASDHNVDANNRQAVSTAISQATGLFNSSYPKLDFSPVNYTDIKSFSLQPGSYPRETQQYINRIKNAVYDAKNSSDFISIINNIKREITGNPLLSELLRMKLLAVSTALVRFSDMMENLIRLNQNYFDPRGSSMFEKSNCDWWCRWGKCLAGILGGGFFGALNGAMAGTSLPGLGTLAGGVLGGVFGGIGGATAAC